MSALCTLNPSLENCTESGNALDWPRYNSPLSDLRASSVSNPSFQQPTFLRNTQWWCDCERVPAGRRKCVAQKVDLLAKDGGFVENLRVVFMCFCFHGVINGQTLSKLSNNRTQKLCADHVRGTFLSTSTG